MENRIIDTDSYKTGMFLQYPPNTRKVFQYFESRGCDRGYESTVFFGAQYILKKYFSTPITMEEVEEANEVITAHGEPFNHEGWKLLVTRHGGKLPLRIRAVPEGTVVPLHNVLMTVENTDPDFGWLPTWFETALVRMWYPITVATQSYYLRQLIYKYLQETSDDPDAEIAFKLHDFGSRGVSSQETAMIGGAAHLTSFMGTDTMAALLLHRKYYHEPMAGFSIPAAEHSTITSWGREHEVDAFRNMLKQFAKPGSLVAVVSDSWDIYHAAEKLWGETLKQEVIDSGATVVIRPDSGVPHIVDLQVAQILADKFGYTVNSKGYKVLNNVRIIQGDGVDYKSIPQILETLKVHGFSATNIAFGSGGGLLQKLNRDTMQFAFKCSAIWVGDEVREVYKEPITSKAKNSKRGILDLVHDENGYRTVKRPIGWSDRIVSELVTYFEDGEVLVDFSLKEIRDRINKSLAA
jgi:nicotinamide phosphoribosyltransferase